MEVMGLVIGSPWIEKILAGEKTCEIRSRPHPHAGKRIALCATGGLIVATCMLRRAIRLNRADIEASFDQHRATRAQIKEIYPQGPLYLYPLSKLVKLDPPIEYKHPGGGSWVKLSAKNVREWGRLQKS